jgi:negative regulator of sigma E activity
LERSVYIESRLSYRLSFDELLKVLEGALAIGRQADLLAPEEVTTRLEAVQQSAPPPKEAASSSKLAKIKAWFAPAA